MQTGIVDSYDYGYGTIVLQIECNGGAWPHYHMYIIRNSDKYVMSDLGIGTERDTALRIYREKCNDMREYLAKHKDAVVEQ